MNFGRTALCINGFHKWKIKIHHLEKYFDQNELCVVILVNTTVTIKKNAVLALPL